MGTITEPALNPALLDAITAEFRSVRLVHPGETRITRRLLDPTTIGKSVTRVVQWGEQYRVDCCFCSDRHGRMHVSYLYGMPDPATARPQYKLWKCFNENCGASEANRYLLWRRLERYVSGQLLPESSAARRVASSEATPPRISLPENLVSLIDLPAEHPAIVYLQARGFDPLELARVWDVSFCASYSCPEYQFENRIVFPLGRVQVAGEPRLAGWQARAIDDALPKYLTAKGTRKSHVLYGLSAALTSTGPCCVVEGATDVWRFGPGAVALLGKSPSAEQLKLLDTLNNRPLAVMLDGDAEEEAVRLAEQLANRRRASGSSHPVRRIGLPDGQDPADCSRNQLHDVLKQAFET